MGGRPFIELCGYSHLCHGPQEQPRRRAPARVTGLLARPAAIDLEEFTTTRGRSGPDLLPAIADWKRQISGHSNVSSKSRSVSGRYDACFADRGGDDFKKALQRKVTFEISEVKASGSVASDGLEAITRSQPLAAFEPREFWKRQGSANPLTASVKNRMSLKSSNFKSLWSVLGMMFLIFDIIVIPLRFFNLPDWWSFADAMNVVTLCYWNMDILVSFFTGYYHRGILVMKPRRIAVHYLRTQKDPQKRLSTA
eukprot:g25658.t1